MTVPLAYNIRNLWVRKTTTLMTAAGIALSAAILVASIALVDGLRSVFANTANPLQLLVLRKAGDSELGSTVSTEDYEILRGKSGIATDPRGQALVSQELVNVANLPRSENPKGMNVTVRGLSTVGIEMRNVHLVRGRWFRPGNREVVVGKAVTDRYPSARVGNHIRFGRGDWEITGVMDCGPSAFNSEIWGDFNQISADYNRQDSSSSVLLRATDSVSLDALEHSIEADPRLNASTITESAYYQYQTNSGAPVEFLGILVSVIMAIGSGFATANILYAAVGRRGKEIATLKTLGYSDASILLSFLSESVLLAGFAGGVGCLIALPLNWVTTGIGSMTSFSEIAFRFHVSARALFSGLLFAVALGGAGGALPAWAAARKEILTALREG